MKNQAYLQLREKVRLALLLRKTPVRGGVDMATTITLFLITVILIMSEVNFLYPVLLGALGMMRATYITHELTHGHYFGCRQSRYWSYIFANIFTGMSRSWWEHKHGKIHHNNTNVINKDGDIAVAGGAFIGQKNFPRLFHRYQHVLFWVLLPLLYFAFFFATVRHVLQYRKWGELCFLVVHLLLPTLLLSTYGFVSVLLLYGAYSIWFSSALIVSHLGMSAVSHQEHRSACRLELVSRTTRNVKGGNFAGWIFGGGNAHIEHHLFPAASKFNLPKVKKVTRNHFKKAGLPYCEKSAFRIYGDIYLFLLNTRAR